MVSFTAGWSLVVLLYLKGSSVRPARIASTLEVKIGNYGRVVPFHGYCGRRVTVASRSAPTSARREKTSTTSNRFTYVAYPAEYGVTGVMTFAIVCNGTTYVSDL